MLTPRSTESAPYRRLAAWQLAMDLMAASYELVDRLPRGRKSALTHQLTRAALSVPLNIAEGYGRRSQSEFAQFLRIALGSLREVETLILACERLGVHASDARLQSTWQIADETGRCLVGLLKRVESRLEPPQSHSQLSV